MYVLYVMYVVYVIYVKSHKPYTSHRLEWRRDVRGAGEDVGGAALEGL
jgi:hypothetical protein